MTSRIAFIALIAGLAAMGTTLFSSDKDAPSELANPQVMSTFPAEGQVLPAGPVTLRVAYDLPMRADSYSFVQSDKGTFPDCADKPRLLTDGRTFEYDCILKPGTKYHVWFNHGRFMNFKSASNSVPAVTYGISFSTRP
jgi:hypothetical protein